MRPHLAGRMAGYDGAKAAGLLFWVRARQASWESGPVERRPDGGGIGRYRR
jgi:hypothetical protein